MSAITNTDPCIICHEIPLETDDTVRCNNERVSHIFHRTCAVEWATTRPVSEEQITCLLCSEGFFLPIQGSFTANESPEELARIAALRQERAALVQEIAALVQENEELEQQSRILSNLNFASGLMIGAGIVTRERPAMQGLALACTLIARNKMPLVFREVVNGIPLGLCITKIALMIIGAGAHSIGRDIEF
jgi:hypothetical protein